MTNVQVLKLNQIQLSEEALRTEVIKDNPKYLELKNSLKKEGFLNSLEVRPLYNEDTSQRINSYGSLLYELVDGRHRYAAATDLSMDEAPCIIRDREDSEILAAQIQANSIRIETTRAQYASALKRIMQHGGMTRKELADKINKSEKWVDEMLSLTKLSEKAKELIDQNKIPYRNAVELAKLPATQVEDFLERAMTMTVEVFGPAVQDHLKEIRAAAREGRKIEEPQFKPVMTLRRLVDIKTELQKKYDTGTFNELQTVLDSNPPTNPYEAAKMTLEWLLHVDAASVASQKAKWEADQQRKKAEKEAREAAKQKKKEEEAQAALQA